MAKNFQTKIIDNITWENLVMKSAQGTLFHSLIWINPIINMNRDMKLYLIGFFKGAELKYGIPIIIQRKLGLNLAFSPIPFTSSPYGGFISADIDDGSQKNEDLLNTVVKELTNYLFHDLKVSYAYIKSSYPINDIRPFKNNGYQIEILYTSVINLNKSNDEIWNNLKGPTRTAIRKAMKNDLKISTDYRTEDLKLIYNMLNNTYKRSDLTSPISESYLVSCLNNLYPGNIKIFFVEKDIEKIACAVIIIYKNILYYWVGASIERYWEYRPMNFLQWEIIKWGIENGFKKYDLIGANTPEISSFKAGYNPDLVQYFVFKKYRNEVVKVLEKIQSFNRKFKRRLL